MKFWIDSLSSAPTCRLTHRLQVEQFRNLTLADKPRRIDKVLKAESKLVRWDDGVNIDPNAAVTAEDDAVTKAEKQLADAKKANPQVPADIAAAEAALQAAKDALETSDGLATLDVNDFTGPGKEGAVERFGIVRLEQIRDGSGCCDDLCCAQSVSPLVEPAFGDAALCQLAPMKAIGRTAHLCADWS